MAQHQFRKDRYCDVQYSCLTTNATSQLLRFLGFYFFGYIFLLKVWHESLLLCMDKVIE